MQYLSDGAVLQTSESCPERLDGTCIPARNRHGGANYFHRETQIMHMVSLCVLRGLVAEWL